MVAGVHTFKNFPEFSRLTLADKEAYESLIKSCPPVDDFTFSSLMTWWNSLDNVSVSILNNNLVISYWIAGDERGSGLSLVGTNKVDESMCAIFDYLRERGMAPRLVNVSEFVISNVQYPELFQFTEMRDKNEYIVPITRFYPLQNTPIYWRHRVRRLLRKIGEENIVVRSLDLSSAENRYMLYAAIDKWHTRGMNNFGVVERDAMIERITHADALDTKNLCLFVNDKLYGFCLYHTPHDKRYVTIKHIKATHETTLSFELMAYAFAKAMSGRGVKYVNLNTDEGLLRLRMFMLALGPVNFFRKYIVEPAG